jgi:hypothetical protein
MLLYINIFYLFEVLLIRILKFFNTLNFLLNLINPIVIIRIIRIYCVYNLNFILFCIIYDKIRFQIKIILLILFILLTCLLRDNTFIINNLKVF